MVRAVVAAAKSGSDHFERPYIGASFEPVTAQIAEALGMARPSGALVANVAPDGPAQKAGLKPGDVVLALNGAEIEHVDALGYRLSTQPLNSTVRLDILRKGIEDEISVKLVRTPEGASATAVEIGGRNPFSGIKVSELSPRLAQRLRMPADVQGVAVIEVQRGSPAENYGFRPGDIVRAVNGEEIISSEQLQQATSQQTRWWRFTVQRGGQVFNQVLRY